MEDRFSNQFSATLFDLVQQGKPRFVFRQGNDDMAASFAQDRIDFPVTEMFSLFNDLWALVNYSLDPAIGLDGHSSHSVCGVSSGSAGGCTDFHPLFCLPKCTDR